MKELYRPDHHNAGGSTILAGHFNRDDTYVTSRPNGMKDWLITYTLSGDGYFLTSGNESICCAGDVTLLKPGTPHQYGTRKGRNWNFVWAHFPGSLHETQLLPNEQLLVHRIENDSAQTRIFRVFEQVISDSQERSLYWRELCENAMRQVLILLAERINTKIDPRIKETLYLLSTKMQEPVRIDDLAKAVGMSPSRLSHLFKENTGSSIIESLNRMRVRQAALLLEHTDRGPSEVAIDVGFHNYNHFASQFRKRYGINPRTYKTKNRSEERQD